MCWYLEKAQFFHQYSVCLLRHFLTDHKIKEMKKWDFTRQL